MPEHHTLMDGRLHVYRRENSGKWQCSADKIFECRRRGGRYGVGGINVRLYLARVSGFASSLEDSIVTRFSRAIVTVDDRNPFRLELDDLGGGKIIYALNIRDGHKRHSFALARRGGEVCSLQWYWNWVNSRAALSRLAKSDELPDVFVVKVSFGHDPPESVPLPKRTIR